MIRAELENMPFKPGEQKNTMERNARMFARLLCLVLRTVQQNHRWCDEYPFDEKQMKAAEDLWAVLDAEKDEPDEAVIEAIHQLGLELFCKERKDISKGEFVCPVYRFLVISSIMQGGSFMSEADITNIIAQLQWCCRAMIYEEIQRKMRRWSEKRAWKKYGRYIKEGRYTAFNSLRQVMHLASHIAYGTSGLPQVEWLDDDYQKASINGKAVTFEDIKKFVFDRLEAAKITLEREVLFGHTFEELGYKCGNIRDPLRHRKIGYSFIESRENGFVKFKNKLLEVLLEDPLVRPFFIRSVRGGKIEWNKDGCKKWLKRTKAFLEAMVPVIHITYGQPSRAEELGGTMIKNRINAMRSVYFSRRLVMLAGGYSKMRSATGKDKLIARFLPEEVGDLLIKYLSLVRPMEALISEEIECEGFDNYEKLLFADEERAWGGERLSDIFMREMNAWGPAAMGFREYRQLITLFMRKHLKELGWDEIDDVRDAQAGHGSRMAGMRYGITADDMAGLTPDELLAFYHASREWHRLLGFKFKDEGTRTVAKEKEDKSVREQEKKQERAQDGLIERLERIEVGLAEMSKKEPARVQSRISPPQPLPPSCSDPCISVSARALRALRKFRGDKTARFKSPEQGKALQLVLDGKKDVLAILPTGGGKSLLFFLPTMLEREMTTVVIVPLIAVMDDLGDRCVNEGISWAIWDPDDRIQERCNILFVAVEHAVEPAFLNHLQKMHNTGILKRIVMDEAHVSLTHRDFRPVMERLVGTMRAVPVQVVLLTATMPPSMEPELRIAMACSIWEVVRADTTRREIGYEVVEVDEEEDSLDVEITFRIKAEMRKWARDGNGELNGNESGIVYCLQKEWADDLCAFLNVELGEHMCGVYHADLSKEVRAAIYKEWQEGTVKILVATSALGVGIDYPHVRFVFHQGQSRSLMDFSQESGRAGRDGKEAQSVVFTSKEMRAKCEWIEQKEHQWAGHLKGGFKAMREWVAGKTVNGVKECRRVGLGLHMDGKAANCLSLGDCVWCDVCKEAMGKASETEDGDERDEEDEDNIYGDRGEMTMSSQSTIDKSAVNVGVAEAERQWQVDTAIKIKEMMGVLHKRCAICWMRKISAKHDIEDCKDEMSGKCLRCQSKDHPVKKCMAVQYRGGNCCWTCGLPQKLGRVHVHGVISIGECEEGYNDKMWPLCWYMWRQMRWKRRLEAHFCREWTEDEFREWISKIDRGITNGVRVMLWAWDEMEKK